MYWVFKILKLVKANFFCKFYRTFSIFCFLSFKLTYNFFVLLRYDETVGGKSSNEMCSLLRQYFETIPNTIKHIHIFTDGCAGQNRNHTLSRFLCTLSSRFSTLRHYYPIRGHSFLPNDQDFATAKRNIRRVDRVYSITQYRDLIATCSDIPNRMQVRIVKVTDFFKFKNFWVPYYRRKVIAEETRKKRNEPRPTTVSFEISKFYDFTYYKDRIVARRLIGDPNVYTFKLKKSAEKCPLPVEKVERKKLDKDHIDCLKKLLKYVPDNAENRRFWKPITPLPTSTSTSTP